jgi:1-acyl-sn-glycerol-3-phosphate acyltransferase
MTPATHTPLSPATARPAPFRGVLSEAVRWVSAAYLKAAGWTMQGDWPALDKLVLVAAPHTSNWDGINMLAAAGYYRVRLRWMGKKSLTAGPFGGILRLLGCVPIDRSRATTW